MNTTLLSGLIPPVIRGKSVDWRQAKYREFLANVTDAALSALLEQRLTQFDALVRDTSCQLRVMEIMRLVGATDLSAEIEEVQAACTGLREANGPDVHISQEIELLVLSHLLSVTRNVNKSGLETTKPGQLKQVGPKVSRKHAEAIVEQAQERLAEISVERLVARMPRLQGQQRVCDCGVLPNKQPRKRQVLPCLPSVRALLEDQNPIELRIHLLMDIESPAIGRLRLFYISEDHELVSTREPHKGPSVVWEGRCVRLSHEGLEADLGKHSLSKVLLANAAAHPQYAGKQRYALVPDQEEAEEVKELTEWALTNGCCKDNPSLFQLTHIYPSGPLEEAP